MKPTLLPEVEKFLNGTEMGHFFGTDKHIAALVGKSVLVRYYNKPGKTFYGETFKGRIIKVDYNNHIGSTPRPYLIESDSIGYPVWVAPYEIRGAVNE